MPATNIFCMCVCVCVQLRSQKNLLNWGRHLQQSNSLGRKSTRMTSLRAKVDFYI